MRRTTVGVLAAGLWLTAAPTLSHHAFSAEFDQDKPIKLTGTVTSMRWSNPHAWIYIDVKDADGKVVNWGFETLAANALYRRGWRPPDVMAGTVVTIEGWPARNGSPTANAGRIVLPDGRQLFSGSPFEAELPPRDGAR